MKEKYESLAVAVLRDVAISRGLDVKGLKKSLPERHHHLIPMNEEAIKVGMDKLVDINVL